MDERKKNMREKKFNKITNFYETQEPKRDQTVEIEVNVDKIINACVDLITIHGLPLSLMNYPAFHSLIDPILKVLPEKISINRKSIRQKIKDRAAQERIITKNLLKDKLVSLKFDFGNDVLGVNSQVIHEGKIVIRALSMNVLFESHTGINTTNHINEVLDRYELSVKQIYTNTTDNANNMRMCSKLLHDMQNVDTDWYEEYIHDENCLDCLGEDWDCQPVTFNFKDTGITEEIDCSPHSFQLGILDFWKVTKSHSVLGKAREAVK